MKSPNLSLNLPVGNVSLTHELGKYYQDFTQALHHYEHEYFGSFDEQGLPLMGFGKDAVYNPVYIIQYALIAHDLVQDGINVSENTDRLHMCMRWLESNEEILKDSIVWRNHFPNPRYELESGWISGMYQGQAISLYLRYGQFINQEEIYCEKALKAFQFFSIDWKDGGVRRYDEDGDLWFEEYPSEKPSFVLNGFVYTLFGFFDLWRITKNQEVKATINQCIQTLKNSLVKYDSGYWSIYDQSKKELATMYYHKNIHIPLMKIMYQLTNEESFDVYSQRWEKQLNSKLNTWVVKIMYRLQPRLRSLRN